MSNMAAVTGGRPREQKKSHCLADYKTLTVRTRPYGPHRYFTAYGHIYLLGGLGIYLPVPVPYALPYGAVGLTPTTGEGEEKTYGRTTKNYRKTLSFSRTRYRVLLPASPCNNPNRYRVKSSRLGRNSFLKKYQYSSRIL